MPVTSRWSIPLPEISLPTFVFGSPDQPLSDKLALIDATRPDTHFLSAQEFRSWAKRVAVGLQKAGLQRGDRVMLFSGNCLFYPIVFMGILMAGGVFTGANPTYVARELAHQLKDSGAKFLLTTDVSIDTALDAASEIGMSRDNIFIFNDDLYDGKGKSQKGLQYWDKLIASQAQGDKFAWEEPENAKETIACLNYSSGTTGVAKGVMITHYNHIANASQMMFLATLHPEYEERLKVERFLAVLP
jgi:4-coumarate--CoA ligase